MKHLILLRHGEAGFSEGTDFQRSLTSRGKENLEKLGRTLQERNFSADLMFCSPAKRTFETSEIIKRYVPIREEIFEQEIYAANLEILIELLESTPKSTETCLLIGHNPTISLLLAYVTDENYIGLQPGMMGIVELQVSDWAEIGKNSGILKEILQ